MRLLTAVFLVANLVASNVAAQAIPERAIQMMPLLNQAVDELWPSLPWRSYIPAQIEQESCISLKHKKCFNPSAELKTVHEYGFGIGQLTIAYNKEGKVRFNAWEEVRTMHPDLHNWQWEDRYNPLLQIKAIVIKNKHNWTRITYPTASLEHKMAFLAVTYNSGSTFKDRSVCARTVGCDPTKWWGNVELYSTKSKKPIKEYGNRSYHQISREYPVNVLNKRRPKYIPHMGS